MQCSGQHKVLQAHLDGFRMSEAESVDETERRAGVCPI